MDSYEFKIIQEQHVQLIQYMTLLIKSIDSLNKTMKIANGVVEDES